MSSSNVREFQGGKSDPEEKHYKPTPSMVPLESDDDLALSFSEKFAGKAICVPGWGRWYLWGGQVWSHDEKNRIFDIAREHCRERLALRLADGDLTKSQQQAARQRYGSASTIWSVVKLAAVDMRHAVTPNDLDSDPWLLNTPAGIVDLRTGALWPHDPMRLCTKITTAALGGDALIFNQFLERIIPSAEVRAYLQRLAGYALTGSSRDHVLPLFIGPGGTGKSTFTNALRRAMGDYAIEVPAELLTESHNERHPCELVPLHGARFVVGSEIDSGKHWNESRVKRLTGGDPICARYIGRDPFEFEPTHTLTVLSNNKPAFRSIDTAMRRRVHLVPFDVQIPEAERDPALPEKLKAEAGGILAWAIAGCIDWQARGLDAPEAIREASSSYLDAEDSIAAWLGERCDRAGQIKLTAAHKDYRDWCTSAGMPPLGRTSFGDQLAAHGIARAVDRKQTVIFSGITLKSIGSEMRIPDDY